LGVGLDSVNAVEREVNARDFDPEAYAIPDSAWRDGPAAGVVVRNKRQGRGKLLAAGTATDAGETVPEVDVPDDIEAIVSEYATDDRFERVVDDLDRRNAGATVDAVADRVVEAIARRRPFGSARAARVRLRIGSAPRSSSGRGSPSTDGRSLFVME